MKTILGIDPENNVVMIAHGADIELPSGHNDMPILTHVLTAEQLEQWHALPPNGGVKFDGSIMTPMPLPEPPSIPHSPAQALADLLVTKGVLSASDIEALTLSQANSFGGPCAVH